MTDYMEKDVKVEFAVERPMGFGASGSQPQTLSDRHLIAIRQNISNLIVNFVPPETELSSEQSGSMRFNSFELQAAFKIFAESDGLVRLLFTKAGGEATIQVKATWSKN